ncbi:MAG: class I SAM-dependent methyltransferase [Acidobacteria bacterium]|nr:class I SAM-dependent methyltransferase [Acidobacteriota bacterium]
MRRWYEELFANYAKTYDKETFTAGTMGEVDFLENEFHFDKTKSILDIGCGTGRHAIELARRGYTVTGIDLSAAQLARAGRKADEAGVRVNFIRLNACDLPFRNEFDFAIMLCEGGFSLQETDELNFKILESAERALRSPGKLIFSCLNALFPLYHNLKDFLNAQPSGVETAKCTFDPLTFRDHTTGTFTDDDGKTFEMEADERYYAPSEISWYLSSLGFRQHSIHGCRLGNFSREHDLTTDDFELLVIAEK